MIIVCPSCQARYKFDEAKLGSRPRARTKCAKCGGSIDIENPLLASMTLPPGTMAPVPAPAPEPPPKAGHDTAPSTAPAAAREGAPATGRTYAYNDKREGGAPGYRPLGVMSSAGERNWPPALLTSRSIRPWRSSVSPTRRWT